MTAQVHPDTFQFFEELTVNNNREWFNDNKLRWADIRDSFMDFTQQLIDAMAPFDPSVQYIEYTEICVSRTTNAPTRPI